MSKKIRRKKNEYGFNIIEHHDVMVPRSANDQLLEIIANVPFLLTGWLFFIQWVVLMLAGWRRWSPHVPPAAVSGELWFGDALHNLVKRLNQSICLVILIFFLSGPLRLMMTGLSEKIEKWAYFAHLSIILMLLLVPNLFNYNYMRSGTPKGYIIFSIILLPYGALSFVNTWLLFSGRQPTDIIKKFKLWVPIVVSVMLFIISVLLAMGLIIPTPLSVED